jgi:hypothetical protein
MTSKLRSSAIVAAHAKLAPSPSAVGCSIFAPACSPVPGNMHRCVGMGISSDAPPPHVRAPCSRALHAHTPRPGRRASHAILREGAIVATLSRYTASACSNFLPACHIDGTIRRPGGMGTGMIPGTLANRGWDPMTANDRVGSSWKNALPWMKGVVCHPDVRCVKTRRIGSRSNVYANVS